MSSAGSPSLSWFVARGSGMLAYILLTAVVVLGIAVSRRWHNERWPRMLVEATHRWLTITFFIFIAVHTVTVLVDPFTHFGLKDVLVPFGSYYRTIWLGLGVIATELGLAIGLSVFLRPLIGYRAWHILHLLTYVLFPLSLLHGIGTGTDTQETWATAIYALSVVLVFGVLIWRTMDLHAWRRVALIGSVAGSAALVVWCLRGPYAPGWAVASGTPKTLLQASAQQKGLPVAAATPSMPTLPSQLLDTVSGQAFPTNGGSGILLRGTGSGSAPLDLAVQLAQSRRQITGQVQLRTGNHLPWCAGPITGVSGGSTILADCSGYGQQVQLSITLQSLNEGGFSGTLQIGPSQ